MTINGLDPDWHSYIVSIKIVQVSDWSNANSHRSTSVWSFLAIYSVPSLSRAHNVRRTAVS